MNLSSQIQILDKVVSISFQTNALDKGMNLFLLPPAVNKIIGHTWFSSFGRTANQREGKGIASSTQAIITIKKHECNSFKI